MTKKPLSLAKNGKIEIRNKLGITKDNLADIYTPGVAEVVKEIMKHPAKVYQYTWKKRSVAIVSDGSAILGLGNQGPEAALPVMEAKAVLFKELANIDAVPIVLRTQNPDEIVQIIKNISPTFGGINIEDIAAPGCFLIKEQLKKELDVPVFHDDQYGTAIVVLAGLINACRVVNKKLEKTKIIISGAGAAGIATAKMLHKYGCRNIILFDSLGSLYRGRSQQMNFAKMRIAQKTNPFKFNGPIQEALSGADIFIGLSRGGLLKAADIEKMSPRSIVFALANPTPEIMPKDARKAGAEVIATGRSDFSNQINNALVFPGIFKGALDTGTVLITDDIKQKIALAIAKIIKKPDRFNIIPGVLNKKVVKTIVNVFKTEKSSPSKK
ncbi:MAG: NADP-dependent malic enzyme [Candidatus Moranbacteria bacterium]|jgi:malate dehydrogenase (oxaloacetate-decarboxylating)|nr:NADP-dependent malic enzyme [Candidatus Moranbacteria bacterium]